MNSLVRASIINKILLLIIIIFFLVFLPTVVIATDESENSYSFTYTVTSEAMVIVNQQIQMKNKLSNIYVSEYSLTVGSNNVSSVVAWDDFGSIEPAIENGPNYTSINIKFNEPVVGKDKVNNLHIRYETPDFTIIKGQVLELNVPVLSNKEELDGYQIKILVPARFGAPSFIQPLPSSIDENSNYRSLYFNKEQLKDIDGIFATFGEEQIFNFKLIYQLENNNKFIGQTDISLPGDTPYQKISYDQLEPSPVEVNVDEDGNWLAVYRLSAGENLTITATGSAELFITPQEELKDPPLLEENYTKYLQPQKYWEIKHPQIQSVADDLKTPEEIYNYVVDNLEYDYSRLTDNIDRFGALHALQNKSSALCSEFADLFIALSRASGIPARQVGGYAYTTNPQLRPLSLSKDILHAWVEYYDSKREVWVPIDPTWGKTTGGIDFFNKMDLNHFAFVRHGVKSDAPPPAGAYSLDSDTKTIFVEFGEKKERQKNASLKAEIPKVVSAGFPLKGSIEVINQGPVAYHNTKLSVAGENYQKELLIPVLPPFDHRKLEVFIPTKWTDKDPYQLTAVFENKQLVVNVEVLPFYQALWLSVIGFLKGTYNVVQSSLSSI